jgi:hypothetical protein
MPSKALEMEISQDEAYQRSGHPILSVSPFIQALLPGIYAVQLRVTGKEVKRDA